MSLTERLINTLILSIWTYPLLDKTPPFVHSIFKYLIFADKGTFENQLFFFKPFCGGVNLA